MTEVDAAAADPPPSASQPVRASTRHVERMRRLARVLDSQFTVPGTQRSFGVDALLGLIPGVGGPLGLVMAASVIGEGVLAGARPSTVVRMVGIAVVDALLGAIPVLGQVSDFVFKANERNARIVASQRLDATRTTEQSRAVLVATIAGIFTALAVVSIATFALLVWLLRAIF